MAHVFLNGSLVEADSAQISVGDGSWLHGAGLFETMRAENGRVFRYAQHAARLQASAERLLRPISAEFLPSEQDCRRLLELNGVETARIRLTVSAGTSTPDESDYGAPNVCASVTDLRGYPEALYRAGVGVILSPFRLSPSDPLAGHKTTCYLPKLLALRAAKSVQRMEALWFTTDHKLAEGSISNVFLVRNGKLQTPPLDTPVLPGIARAVVLEAAASAAITAEQVALTIDDVLAADEIFLTNTIMQVLPVNAVERHTVGDGQPGQVTTMLYERFREMVQRECDRGCD